MNFTAGVKGRTNIRLLVSAILVGTLTLAAMELVGEMQAVAGLFFVFLVAVSIHKYRYGIFLVVFLLPLSATRVIPREMLGVTGLNPFNIAMLLAVTLIFFTWVVQPYKVLIPRLPIHFRCYVAVLVLATAIGMTHVGEIPTYFKAFQVITFDSVAGYVLDVLIKPSLILAVAVLVAIGVRNSPQSRAFLIPLFAAAAVLPLSVIAEVVILRTPLSSMVAGGESFSGMHVNELGLMFNMAFSLALFCFFCHRRVPGRWLLGLITLILMAGILLTFSRGAYLGFLTVIACFLYRKRRFDFMLMGLLVLPVAAAFMPEAVLQRASTGLGAGDVDTISAGRINDIWRPLMPEFAASPAVGQGLSSVLWCEPAMNNNFFTAGRIGHPHSAYLGMLLDFGVLGAAVICAFFWHMWRTFIELAKTHHEPLWRDFFSGASVCLLVLMVQGITDDRVTPTVAQVFLWLAYGAGLGFLAQQRTAPRDAGTSAPRADEAHA